MSGDSLVDVVNEILHPERAYATSTRRAARAAEEANALALRFIEMQNDSALAAAKAAKAANMATIAAAIAAILNAICAVILLALQFRGIS